MAQKHAVDGLTKWVDRDEWFDAFKETVDEHVMAACDANGLDFENLDSVIGEANYTALWNAAFEDFLTRELDDGRNVTDDYLKRRGWRESPGNRAYLQALRHAPMSAYAVEVVTPGQGFRAQDLLRDRGSVEVHEPELSRLVEQWDILAARIFEVRGRWRIGSVFLELDDVALEDLEERLAMLHEAAQAQSRAILEDAGDTGDAALVASLADRDTLLLVSGFLFTDLWLRQVIDDIFSATLATLVTRDGEPLEAATASYTLAPGTSAAALETLLASQACLRPTPDEDEGEDQNDAPEADYRGWKIVDTEAPPAAPDGAHAPDGPRVFDPRDDDGAQILGSVTLAGGTLAIRASARSHLARARAILEPALGERVGPPEIEHASFDERRSSGKAEPEA